MLKSAEQIKAHKVGAEHIIMMRLPFERFIDHIPSHFTPPLDRKSRCQIAILAQVCSSNSFDNNEAGPTDEFHLWLQVGSSEADVHLEGADSMLPTMHWYSILSASSNSSATSYLESFGLLPSKLESIELRETEGSMDFPDGGLIEWSVAGTGDELAHLGIHHVLYVAGDGPDAVGHHVDALLSGASMDQLGKVHVKTAALEPFLHENEKFAVMVNRASSLQADIVWQLHTK